FELTAAASATRTGHSETTLLERRDCFVFVRGAAVRVHMRDLEPDPVGSKRSIDERERRRVGAVGAVNAPDRRSANRELVGVGLAAVGSPAAAIVVGILRRGRACDGQYGDEDHSQSHGTGSVYEVVVGLAFLLGEQVAAVA